MAIVVKDRVKETFTTTGTADFTLIGAVVGFQAFSAIGNTNFTYYAAVDPATGDWEVGYGQYQTSGPTLTRNTILSSSAAGAKVSFGAGSKDVFCTYPSEKAIYEEAAGNVIFDGGPITVVGNGVTSYTSFTNFFAEMFGDANTYVQQYIQNQNSGSDASADYVALNDIGTDTEYYVDMGMNSSGYTSGTFQIYTPNSGYVYSIGGANPSKLFIGSGDDDLILHAGGFATANIAATISGADQSITTTSDVNVGGALDVTGAADITGAATFGSTVTLNANPSLALQAATKAYVDEQVTAGLHIHEPVRVETTGNLNATYTSGGTNANIIQIANGTDITFFGVSASVGDQFYIGSASNGLLANTAYFVVNIVSGTTIQASLTFGGAIVTGLTNGSPTIPSVINSGVGATLTNAGAQAALQIDGINLVATNRVMVRLQTNGAENGVYTVTTVGDGSTNWVLTRATDSDRVNPADPNGVGTGDYYFTREGLLNAGDSHVLTTEPNTMIIGYTTLTYTQFSGGVVYTGGTNINVTGQTISLTGTVAPTNGGTGVNTVTTGDLLYGSAANTWSKLALGGAYRSLTVNAGGTQVEWNAVALDQSNAVSGTLPVGYGGTGITGYAQGEMLYANTASSLDKVTANTTTTKKFLSQTGNGTAGLAPTWAQPAASDITGLAASATTDTTDASNIASGTLGTSRLSGSYTGVTGVGTLTAGTWNATAIGAVYGGTGLTSYAVGDLLYADTTTSLAKLSDVAVGNALISGGVSANPSWGKIGLATHVDGTLPIANGGTGTTSTTFANLTTNVTGTLPVGNGGTGAATFTANNVLLGNGTSAFQVVAPGSNGNVLQSNGTTWVSASAPSGMVYPGAGIPNSTGTSWGTSYSTTGSGTVVALANSPSFTGNVGFGVTSSAWAAGWANIQVGPSTALASDAVSSTRLYNNAYYNGTNLIRIGTGIVSSMQLQTDGFCRWYYAASGAAGSTISLTQTAALDTSGNFTATGTVAGTNITAAGNIIGNAATSTSSPLLSALGSYVWNASTLPNSYNLGIQSSFVSSTEGFPNYGQVMTMRSYSGGGGSLQMFVPYSPTYGGTGMQVRFGNYDVSSGNSWTAWKTLIASDTATWQRITGNAITYGSYGSIGVSGTTNGYAGISFADVTGTLMMSTAATGFYYSNSTWRVYWDVSGNQINIGNVTAYSSDGRLKKNVLPISNALSKVNRIAGVTYDWDLEECNKWDFYPPENDVGVIAQDVQAVEPHAVKFAPFDRDPLDQGKSKSGKDYLTVQYEKLVPLLIEAVKELSGKVTTLEAKLEQLTKDRS